MKSKAFATTILALALLAGPVLAHAFAPPPPPPPAYLDDGNEPPENPFLADSPWPMSHRNPYNQASSPWAGLNQNDAICVDYLLGAPGAVTLAYSNPDASGNRAIWTNTPINTNKIDPRGTSVP